MDNELEIKGFVMLAVQIRQELIIEDGRIGVQTNQRIYFSVRSVEPDILIIQNGVQYGILSTILNTLKSTYREEYYSRIKSSYWMKTQEKVSANHVAKSLAIFILMQKVNGLLSN